MADVDDLKDATFLEITVNTSEQMVENLGELMPNLQQLKLNNSSLARCVFYLNQQIRNNRKALVYSNGNT